MEMSFLKGVHQGERNCVVMGCGSSVTQLQPYLDKCFKIGVNDIGDFCDPDMLVILDEKSAFTQTRQDTIINTRPSMLVSHINYWDKAITAPHDFFKATIGSRSHHQFDEDLRNGRLPIATTSTYCATVLAYYMGFKRIGMIGVDFTQNHYNNPDGTHKLNSRLDEVNTSYKFLYQKLKENDVEFWNLSKDSLIEVPKMELAEFFNH